MPISHTCPNCCAELGAIRALPDPVYGLRVVVCPGCATACVRTKHPEARFWRDRRRRRSAIHRLSITLVFVAGSWLLLIALAHGIARGDIELGNIRHNNEAAIGAVIMIGVLCLLGALVRLLLSFRPRWHSAAAITVGAFALLAIRTALTRVGDWFSNTTRTYNPWGARIHTPSEIAEVAGAILVLMIPVLIGIAIGELLIWLDQRSFWRRVKKGRKKRRQRLGAKG